jgi:3-hydroxyacyl-CoA dehydrogenase/enoyl-CoA hydratase/3-hydroxybutyryl-CoA epimerase
MERDGRVAVALFDLPGASVNTLTTAVGDELIELLERLAGDDTVDAAVLISGKKDMFIAGADIDQFVALVTAEDAGQLSRAGQQMVEQVAAFPKPLVAAIHGACLGGGLELAMAARYRVASNAPVTQLGLPEVQLGIVPAASGCQRLPRLIGLPSALDMILTGRPARPARALRIGLVDEVVPESILRHVATAAAARLASGWQPRRRTRRRVQTLLLDRNPLGRWLVLRQARGQVMKRTGGHYPAPLAAIDAIGRGLASGVAAGLAREAELFGELAVGQVSRRLVQIFLTTTALKKDAGADTGSGSVRSVDVGPVERLGVIGAGFMGAAIAGVSVLRAGVDVRLRDTDWERVAHGIATAKCVLDEALRRRRLDRYEHYRRAALLSGSPDTSGFRRRDLVIEAVFEDVDVKRQTIADLEHVVGDECVLASNTSTIPIGRLQEGARRPERIVGIHFFSPVERMPLVEVIRGPATADRATAVAVRFGQRLGKTVIVVRDAPGFWVNRILAPYLNEAGWLLDEGASIDAIDRTMTRLGFPVGPLALLDEVGLDVAGKAAAVLHAALGGRLAPAPAVGGLIEAGRLGRKSGRGFYHYERGKRRTPDESVRGLIRPRQATLRPAPAETERRLLLAMLNEAARAMAEDITRSPGDGDLGAVMGFGFPPYLGGPLRYIDDQGAATVVAELEDYADRIGPRFAPAGVLIDMARTGRTFYHWR